MYRLDRQTCQMVKGETIKKYIADPCPIAPIVFCLWKVTGESFGCQFTHIHRCAQTRKYAAPVPTQLATEMHQLLVRRYFRTLVKPR